MASTYIVGYRGGLIAAGAGALYVASMVSWKAAYLCMAALVLVGVVTVLLRPEPERLSLSTQLIHEPGCAPSCAPAAAPRLATAPGRWIIGAIVCPFTDFFTRYRRQALWLLVFVAVFRISDLAMASMAHPLYIDLASRWPPSPT